MLQHNNNKEVWVKICEVFWLFSSFTGWKYEVFSPLCVCVLLLALQWSDRRKQANSDICNSSQSHGCWLGVHYSGRFLLPDFCWHVYSTDCSSTASFHQSAVGHMMWIDVCIIFINMIHRRVCTPMQPMCTPVWQRNSQRLKTGGSSLWSRSFFVYGGTLLPQTPIRDK